jgi:hemerythrin superfamily protein
MRQFATTKHSHSQQSPAKDIGIETVGNESLVTTILHKDHLKVLDMFFQYQLLETSKEKQALVEKVLKELFVHATIEETIVYPHVRKEAADYEGTDKLVDESEIDHHVVKVLMSELSVMQPDDELYDAKVCVLGELVRHHAQEEEKWMFPKMKETEMDLEKLAQNCLAKKEELQTMSMQEMLDDLDQQLQQESGAIAGKTRKKHS